LAQDKLLGTAEDAARLNARRNSNANRGLQIVVGHYNGNLPAERMSNLTEGTKILSEVNFFRFRRDQCKQLQSD
jgi:hypothetical protein